MRSQAEPGGGGLDTHPRILFKFLAEDRVLRKFFKMYEFLKVYFSSETERVSAMNV